MSSFDQNGNLIPYTFVSLKLAEINRDFVISFPASTTHFSLYTHFVSYTSALKELVAQSIHQWLGGSFISAKSDPNDIDCVNLIEFNEKLEQNVDLLMPFLLIGGSHDTYYVDGHLIAIYPPNDERYEAITVPSMTYWQLFLMNDKQNNPRGIVELTDID